MQVSGHAIARPHTNVHITEATTNYGVDSVTASTQESSSCINRLSPVHHWGGDLQVCHCANDKALQNVVCQCQWLQKTDRRECMLLFKDGDCTAK